MELEGEVAVEVRTVDVDEAASVVIGFVVTDVEIVLVGSEGVVYLVVEVVGAAGISHASNVTLAVTPVPTGGVK